MDIRCYSCGENDHIAKTCPKMHFVCDTEKLRKRKNLNNKRRSKMLKRRPKKYYSARFFSKHLNFIVLNFKSCINEYLELGLIININHDLLDIEDNDFISSPICYKLDQISKIFSTKKKFITTVNLI